MRVRVIVKARKTPRRRFRPGCRLRPRLRLGVEAERPAGGDTRAMKDLRRLGLDYSRWVVRYTHHGETPTFYKSGVGLSIGELAGLRWAVVGPLWG